jgi:hypothetical protein
MGSPAFPAASKRNREIRRREAARIISLIAPFAVEAGALGTPPTHRLLALLRAFLDTCA